MTVSNAYEFIKSSGPFVVSTVTCDSKPNSRPFGAISCDGNYLYIATNVCKNVCKEIENNNNILLYSLKPGTREWLRVSAVAYLTNNEEDILRLFNDNKILYERYNGTNDPNLKVFRLEITNINKY